MAADNKINIGYENLHNRIKLTILSSPELTYGGNSHGRKDFHVTNSGGPTQQTCDKELVTSFYKKKLKFRQESKAEQS